MGWRSILCFNGIAICGCVCVRVHTCAPVQWIKVCQCVCLLYLCDYAGALNCACNGIKCSKCLEFKNLKLKLARGKCVPVKLKSEP